jgi:hypothetical protein
MTPQPQSTDKARASSGAYRHLVADNGRHALFAFMTITRILQTTCFSFLVLD